MTNDTLVQVESHISLVETEMVQSLMEFGQSRGWNFQPMPYRGVLRFGEKVADETFIYELYIDQPLHPVAEQQLFEIGCQRNIRIEQVLYGKEVEPPNEIDWEKVRERTTSILSGLRAATEAVFEILAEADPCTVAVLADKNQFGEDEYSWVALCQWF